LRDEFSFEGGFDIFDSSFVTLLEGYLSLDYPKSALGCQRPNLDSTFAGGFI